jgi:pimeloyl-ACP methyl ester carboxylesterase
VLQGGGPIAAPRREGAPATAGHPGRVATPGRRRPTPYIQCLLLWPGVRGADFNASPEITREQTVAGGRLWLCRSCGAYGRLPSLRAPTLVADGRRDILEPPGNSRIIARRIPRARLTLYGAAGHAFLFQRRVDFAAGSTPSSTELSTARRRAPLRGASKRSAAEPRRRVRGRSGSGEGERLCPALATLARR